VSHPEQRGFFDLVSSCNGDVVPGATVVEIGSWDVNGSIRSSFAMAGEYIGVDLAAGPGVDVVAYGHELDLADDSVDICISGECFEHDALWAKTFENMIRMTRPGGLVTFSCASRGRVEHGTTRTGAEFSPGTSTVGLNHYRNLSESDFTSALALGEKFEQYRFWYNPTSSDLYFAGVVRGGDPRLPTARVPRDEDVRRLESLMPARDRLVLLPVRAARRVLRDEDRFQDFGVFYQRSLLRAKRAVTSLRRG
jgi:SAM-dependent methyltransferase